MGIDPTATLELSEVAASSGPLTRRAERLLGALRRVIPFDSAWLALADPNRNRYTCLASAGLDASTLDYLSSPVPALGIDMDGVHRAHPPSSPSGVRDASGQQPVWGRFLMPDGYNDALAVALLGPGSRHVGFVALLYGSREPPSSEARRLLGRLTPALANAIDPMRSLLAAARLVRGATAGVALHEDGETELLPGLEHHPLLARDSPVLVIAREAVAAGHVHTSFLWPTRGSYGAAGHVRITALAAAEDVPAPRTGVVLVSPPGDLHGLTPRELEVLGLLVDGYSNCEVARALVVAQRTVAAHVEHILVKLKAPTRTLAAVRAERAGLYIPWLPGTPWVTV
jgi:DNA-binding CsgD family transcriptional regulator